jgi:ribonuclease G
VAELFIEREAHRGVVGNIYKGRVTRVLPGMQSAFVDIGLERDAFLYVADVLEDLDENLLTPEEQGHHRPPPIEERLHEGQDVLVQVVKEPLGTKGARITAHVSLPGRYLVFMPTVEHVGVSRKITDEDERRRLKAILKRIRQDREGGGFIARTAGLGRAEEDFDRDARYLTRTWDEVRAVCTRERAPVLLHRELGLVQRLLRDLLSDGIGSIRLDDAGEYRQTVDLVSQLQPELIPRVQHVTGPGCILEEHGVAGELERALRSKVWLESGGYIVVNQTEALVAVDVNTGRYTGKKNLEETIVKTNLDAVREVVRQIRLRDLGGIIVVDFIDMEERKNRQRVMAALEQELRKDRSPSKLLSVNEFGLVILTRKRVRQSLERTLCQPCPYCTGSGMIKSVATVCAEIYDEVKKLTADAALRGHRLRLRVNPEVARALAGDEAGVLRELVRMVGQEVTVQADPLLHQEQFDVLPA